MKILLAVDGSEHSERAARHLIRSLEGCERKEVIVLNVQEAIDAPELTSHMPQNELEAMLAARGGDALAPARAVLDAAGVSYTPVVLIGPVAETIARYAKEQDCAKIVMGRRGLGALGSALLGSVSQRILQLTDLPVTLVK